MLFESDIATAARDLEWVIERSLLSVLKKGAPFFVYLLLRRNRRA
jgi:hypothetical protein